MSYSLNKKQSLGVTLIELVAVLLILGVLAAVAIPRFVNLSDAARASTLQALAGSAKSINTLVISKVQAGVDVQEVPGRDDLIDIDIDEDGSFETRLKWGFLDNTDLEKWLSLSDSFVISYSGIDLTFIGYDIDGNGDAQNDNCYFRYRQANTEGSQPEYLIVSSGCS